MMAPSLPASGFGRPTGKEELFGIVSKQLAGERKRP